MRKILLLLMLCSLPLPSLAQQVQSESGAGQDITAKLRFAAAQHGVILALLKDGDFSSVLSEFRQILELELTGEYEKPVVQEAWLIAEQMREAGEYELAHQIVDETLDQMETPESQFYLLMLRGKIFHDEGLTEQAIEAFRQAQEFKE